MSEWEPLYQLWARMMGQPAPRQSQFAAWLRYHAPETIEAAIVKTSHRAKDAAMSLDHKIRYCSRLCNQATFELYERSKQVCVTSSEATN